LFRSVLVPLDGSSLAEQALTVAASIAERHGASLSLVVVHPYGPVEDAPRPGTRADRVLREDAGVYLNQMTQAVATAYRIPVYESVLDGDSGPKLVEFARTRGIDLVVASTHGYGRVGRLKVGGVAGHLVHDLSSSVLFIKPQVGPVRMTAHGGFGRILVALDGSRRAEAALDPAVALAAKDTAMLALVRVIPPARPRLEERREKAGRYLASLARRLHGAGRRIQIAVPVGPSPARAIMTYAEQEGMELIALATRERGAMARAFFGSIADTALHKAKIPVLVCHALPTLTNSPVKLAGTAR
jgi:nucleotide-binding universal stress UspA family protein